MFQSGYLDKHELRPGIQRIRTVKTWCGRRFLAQAQVQEELAREMVAADEPSGGAAMELIPRDTRAEWV